jgi:hypothetical protein
LLDGRIGYSLLWGDGVVCCLDTQQRDGDLRDALGAAAACIVGIYILPVCIKHVQRGVGVSGRQGETVNRVQKQMCWRVNW